MKNLKFLQVFLFVFFCASANAQLSGVYTIGGNNPNYATISQAVAALQSVGVSGPVTFNIRNGVYTDHIDLGNWIGGASATNYILFQSESGDSSQVTITWNSAFQPTVKSNLVPVKYKSLTFTNSSNYVFDLTVNDLDIQSCVIGDPSHIYPYTSFITCYGGQILRSQFWDNMETWNSGTANLYVRYCDFRRQFVITGPCQAIMNSFHDNVDGTGGPMLFDNDSLLNGISTMGVFLTVRNCRISEDPANPSSAVHCTQGNVNFYSNDVTGHIYFDNSTGAKLVGNRMNGFVYLDGDDNSQLLNNFIDSLQVYSANCKIYSNNFPSAGLLLLSTLNDQGNYRNNILPGTIWGAVSLNYFFNNDYYPSGGAFDTQPWHFDPAYANGLYAQNQQLIGRGVPQSIVIYDIDSIPRSSYQTLGANEICISEDSISPACGDSVYLRLCSLQNIFHTWTPASGLNDSTAAVPVAAPLTTTTYYACDSNGAHIDSVTLVVHPFSVQAVADSLVFCGDSVMLQATWNAGAVYQWSPTFGLNDPSSDHPKALALTDTMYIVTATVGGCASSSDTVHLHVDPQPRALFTIGGSGLSIDFINLSTCADSCEWFFGDGDSSSTWNPLHYYPNCGYYYVTLIAINSYGADTALYYIYVCDVGIPPVDFTATQVYPNPTTGTIYLKYDPALSPPVSVSVTNLVGEILLSREVDAGNSGEFAIDLGALPDGVYLLRVVYDDSEEVRKIILQR